MGLSSEDERPRPKRARRKGIIKIFLPRLIDTTPGAFEKFTAEQKRKREEMLKEDKLNEEKIKKYFYDIEALQHYKDAEFDEFVREELKKYKKKKGLKDGEFRLDNFMSEFIRNFEKEKLLKPKLNYLSPVCFRSHDIESIDEEENSREVQSKKSDKSSECIDMMNNLRLNRRLKSIDKAEKSLRRILEIINQDEFK